MYDTLGDRWYTAYDDPVALLRSESRIKNPWIAARIQKETGSRQGLKILDIGCGAGFLSNYLASEKYQVTGLDLSKESLAVARRHNSTASVTYVEGNAYALPFVDREFDVVTCMDFLEHVEDPRRIIAEAARVLKSEGLFFFHTFNRNIAARFVIIKMVEWFVQNTPKHMHVLELFIKPEELRQYCHESGLAIKEITGIRPKFSTVNTKNLLARTVPRNFEFKLTKSLMLAYLGYAKKEN